MGYIKKLKNNELVGGTDKTTIYPVTSTEAVFEEVSESNFKSQKFLNNNITGDRINKETITDYNIAVGTVTKEKLTPQVQTMLDEGQKKALTPKGDYNPEDVYEALDLVFDRESNSSYVSLITPNTEPLTNEDAWEMFLDGTAVNTAQATIDAKVGELDEQVDQAIEDARQELQDATNAANGAAELAMDVVANKVADAQVGYFECNTIAGTALKQTTFDYIGTGDDKSYYTIPAAGSNVRIKMQYANTASGTVELQFGSNTATRKQLIYNGEPASSSNSWDDGEVISIYYDNTYNNGVGAYQASNTQGGGSAIKKRVLTFSPGFYDTTNAPSQGEAPSSRTSNTNFKSVKVPVSEGDFIVMNGKSSQYLNSMFWATIGSSNKFVNYSGTNAGGIDYNMVIPEGITALIINCDTRVYANPSGYYIKKGSAEYKEVTDRYLYEDLRTITVGQIYEVNEVVKTPYKQFRKVSKDIKAFSLSETLAIGDIRTSDNATYRVASSVGIFNPSTTYTAGAYALGSMTVYTLTVTADTITAGNITVNGTEVAIESTDDAAAIASRIADALVIDGWTTSVSDNVVTVRCDTIGNNTTTITIGVGDTGVVVSGISTPSETGTSVIRK